MKKLRFITLSASAVSLSLILGTIKIFSMPFGGSVTLGRSVPLIILSYKCGYKVGLFASLIYSLVHFALSFEIMPVKDLFSFFLLIILDYILPYLVLGLSPLFLIKLKNEHHKIYIGTTISFILKIIISTVSGAVLWTEYIPFKAYVWLYCFIYNFAYLILEYLISICIIKKLNKTF